MKRNRILNTTDGLLAKMESILANKPLVVFRLRFRFIFMMSGRGFVSRLSRVDRITFDFVTPSHQHPDDGGVDTPQNVRNSYMTLVT